MHLTLARPCEGVHKSTFSLTSPAVSRMSGSWEEKQLRVYFKRQSGEIAHEKTWIYLRQGNLKKEIETLLTAAQNNAKRTNYAKAKIDKIYCERGPYQVLPLWTRVDLEAIAIKGYSVLPKAPALAEAHHQIV